MKKHTFELSTTNMILFQIRSSFRNTIALVHQRCGQRLRFSYLSLQTRKLLHFSKMYTCWQHWRKERLDTSRYTAQAQAQYDEALSIGVNGIPSFIIGKYFFSGAQPYELFKRVAGMAQEQEGAGEG